MSTKHRAYLPILAAITLLIAIATIVHFQQRTIPVVPANADPSVFSGQRAFEQLQALLQEGQPHAVDTVANRKVEERIVARLRDLGYEEEIQADTVCNNFRRGNVRYGLSRCVYARNIIVTIPGRDAGNGILLSAHYDSVPAAPGASDAGAAVASLLEIARLLTLETQPRNTIVLLFNEGEETGLHGAKLFMEKHPLAQQLQVAINIEARGTSSRSVLFETGENSGWLIKHYAATTPAPLSSSLFYEIYKVLPNDTDLTIYKEHGLQGINFAHADNEAHYHTPLDNLANLDKGSLQHHGDNAWGVLKNIKDLDLNAVKPGNIVYTDILGITLIAWSEGTSLLLAVLFGAMLFGLVWLMQHRQQLRLRDIVLTMCLATAIMLACTLLSYVAQFVVQKLSGHAQPWRSGSLPMEIGLWSLCLIVPMLFGYWAKRLQHPTLVLIGLCAWYWLFALASSIYLIGISFLFLLPLGVALLFLLVAALKPEIKLLNYCTILALPVVTSILFLPVAYFIEIAMGFQVAFIIGLLLSFIAITFLPLFSFSKITAKQLNLVIIALTFVSVAGFAKTVSQAPYTEFKPQPLNLIYLQDDNLENDSANQETEHQDGSAKLIAEAMEGFLPPSLATLYGAIEKGAVLPWSNNEVIYKAVNSIAQAPAAFTIDSINQNRSEKIVSLKFNGNQNQDNADVVAITLLVPNQHSLQSITINDQVLSYENAVAIVNNTLVYQCLGQSCAQQRLTLRFLTSATSPITVATHRQGLPPALQRYANAREGLSVQRQRGDQSIVLTRANL